MKKLLFLYCVFALSLSITAFAAEVEDVPPTILVDSAETLANESGERVYVSYGEWNSAGNYEGWNVTNAASSSVSGGVLTATENIGGDAMTIEYSFSSAPFTANLDYGYKEFLQIRCKVPSGFAGDFEFRYKTTFPSGAAYSDNTVFTIPAGTLIADDAWHIYIIDLGLERRWRGDLRGLMMKPFSQTTPNSRTIEIDYVRLGDLASDLLGLNTDLNFYTGEPLGVCSNVQSKHFAIWWSPHTDVLYADQYGPFASLTDRHRTCLRLLEETWQYYEKVLGYPGPFIDTDGSTPGRYKFTITTWWEGGWMSNYHGFTYNNFGPPDMGTDHAFNPIRHEMGHGVQGVCTGYLNGRHWESHVGYMHNSCAAYIGPVSDPDMGISSYLSWVDYTDKVAWQSCLMFETRGFVYADRRPYLYLDFDLDGLGFQPSFCVKMWNSGSKDEYFHTALLRELPVGIDYEDVTLGWSRRLKLFDIPGGEDKRNWYFNNPNKSEQTKLTNYFQHSMMLAPCPDKAGWWRSTSGTSPMKMGYSNYELEVPASGSVTMTLEMCDIPGTADGLRWCLAAAEDDFYGEQNPRYSGFFKPGETHTFTLEPAETHLYLIVAGTPNPIQYNLVAEESMYNLDKHPLRLRYPFEVNIIGTTPKTESVDVYTRTIGAGHAHSNGGGFVENTASVASTAYVGPDARVLGSAQVTDNARIEGHATIINARIQDNARVSGRALVYGSGSYITGEARIRDRAVVYSGADMSGNSLLCDHARWVSGTITDNAICRGMAWTYGGPTINGHAILDGDYVREWNFNDGVHKGHYPWDGYLYHYDDYSSLLKKPAGLVARYRIEESDGEILLDTLGSTHAFIRGTPARVYDAAMNANVLSLNGADQHVLLDPVIGDSKQLSFSGWCKLTDRVAGATLLYLGHRSDEYIKLVPSNASELVELTIRKRSGETLILTSTTSITLDKWAQIAFTTDSSIVRLYVNGSLENEGTIAFNPYEMITPDLQATAQANYIGRDWSGNYLAAKLADIQFYNMTMSAPSVFEMFNQWGRFLGRFYKDSAKYLPNGSTEIINTGISSTMEGTIMADVYSELNDNVSYYRAIVDSWNYISGHYMEFQYASGMPSIGIDNGYYVVMLQSAGRWNTGVPCPLNTWHNVALVYTQNSAKLYINGSLAASKSTWQNYPAGAVYRIGSSMRSGVSRFVGSLKNVRIFDKAFDSVEITLAVLDESPSGIIITDNDPPMPNPATFSTPPAVLNNSEIVMAATTGIDVSVPVQYLFEEISGNPGGSSSDWQESTVYTDTGLTSGTEYTYTVKMKDLFGNTTAASAPVSVSTLPTSEDVLMDNFNEGHNFLTEGVTGTVWDGFLGKGTGETAEKLNSNMDRAGQLFMESQNANWESFNPLGPFLYKEVAGDFTATVRVTESENITWNCGGIMARASMDPDVGGTGEDFVAVDHFLVVNLNMVRSIDNGTETETNQGGVKPYLRLTRTGNTFTMEVSDNGTSWSSVVGSPKNRPDLDGFALQVGLQQATYNSNTGHMAFDDFQLEFSLVFIAPVSPKDDATDVPVDSDLSWVVYSEVAGFDVYFGDDILSVAGACRLTGDVNGDGEVNLSDVEEFALQWLMAPPCGPLKSSDLNDDGDVDFSDFALIAGNFTAVGDGIFKGHFTSDTDTFDPGIMPGGTEFYWRVDGVDINGDILRGPVWKFTTE